MHLLTIIKTWFTPPKFSNDTEKNMQVNLLNANMVFINSYVVLVALMYVLGAPMAILTLLLNLILFFAILIFRRWLYNGKIMAAGLGFLVAGFILITLVIISMGTITSPATNTYVLIVIIAGVLFKLRGVLISTVATSTAVLALILAENAQMLPAALDFSVIPQWLTYSLVFLVSGSVINYGMQTMRKTLNALKNEMEERNQASLLQETVYQITAAAQTSDSLQELYSRIQAHIARVMPANNFYIALYDAATDLISFPFSMDEVNNDYVAPYKPTKGLTAYVLKHGHSLLYRADKHKELPADFQWFGQECTIWLGVPLIVRGKTIGVMAVQHYSDPMAYADREQQILEFVSSQVATAIDRKQTEEQLRESNERFRQIADNIQEVFWIWDYEQNKLIYINQAYKTWMGDDQNRETLTQYAFLNSILAEDNQIVLAALNDQAMGMRTEINFRVQHPDGNIHWVRDHCFPILNEQGKLVRKAGITSDITDIKIAESKLENVNQELEKRVEERTAELQLSEENLRLNSDELKAVNFSLAKASRLKDEFLASMSHELRTPLTGILGLSEALQLQNQGDLNQKQLKALKMIEKSGWHLLDMINDILDLSKIEAEKFILEFEFCRIDDVCDESLQLSRGMAQQKRQRVAFSSDSGGAVVRADPRRLKQILVNLLSNAIKFTPEEGQIGVEIKASKRDHLVSITVWDEGIGIKKEDIQHLFKPFTQLDASLSRQYSGTGLGLSLVDRLAKLQGFSVEVESEPGKGSRFTINIPWSSEIPTAADLSNKPANNTDTRQGSRDANTDSARATILFADDNDLIVETFSDFLENNGYNVIVAHDGIELVNITSISAPDLILADIQMPGLDGLRAIQQIRAMADKRMKNVPIIALTALAMAGDEEKCIAAGADKYISKPVPLANLLEIVDSLLKNRPTI